MAAVTGSRPVINTSRRGVGRKHAVRGTGTNANRVTAQESEPHATVGVGAAICTGNPSDRESATLSYDCQKSWQICG